MKAALESTIDPTKAHLDHREGNTFFVRIGILSTVVEIKLQQRGQYVWFHSSHAIRTPTQSGAYHPSRPFNDSPEHALHDALFSLTLHYDQAVRSGHPPAESWLVPHRRPGAAQLSESTRQVLRALITTWRNASAAESDPAGHRAFGVPIEILKRALQNPDATHEDIRKAIPVCPAYPVGGREMLEELANAERDGRVVHFIEPGDGTYSYDIE